MSVTNHFQRGALALVLALSGCGDDNPAQTECGAGTMLVDGVCRTDATCGPGTTLTNGECVSNNNAVCGAGTILINGSCVPAPTESYRQIEHLARPGIAEALIITPAFLAGYNATAPSFAGAPAADVAAITAEVKTVLKALYLGGCLLNGVVGFTDPAVGVKPAGVQCAETGGRLWVGDSATAGTTLKGPVATAAQAYADRVFGQFETDVMRINTAVPSDYLTLCAGAAAGSPLLCGGRKLNDDVIDITYFYLLAGAAVPTGTTSLNASQVVALVTDGVFFSSNNNENDGITDANGAKLGTPDPTNLNQFKQSCTNCENVATIATFPYSARPH